LLRHPARAVPAVAPGTRRPHAPPGGEGRSRLRGRSVKGPRPGAAPFWGAWPTLAVGHAPRKRRRTRATPLAMAVVVGMWLLGAGAACTNHDPGPYHAAV